MKIVSRTDKKAGICVGSNEDYFEIYKILFRYFVFYLYFPVYFCRKSRKTFGACITANKCSSFFHYYFHINIKSLKHRFIWLRQQQIRNTFVTKMGFPYYLYRIILVYYSLNNTGLISQWLPLDGKNFAWGREV